MSLAHLGCLLLELVPEQKKENFEATLGESLHTHPSPATASLCGPSEAEYTKCAQGYQIHPSRLPPRRIIGYLCAPAETLHTLAQSILWSFAG